MIEPIPTYYNDRLYRSRTEADWARVFDALEWGADYEPTIDFPRVPRGRWLPDFRIMAPGYAPILVEVKGVAAIEDLATHAEVLRAAENANSIGLRLLAVGPRPHKSFYPDTT